MSIPGAFSFAPIPAGAFPDAGFFLWMYGSPGILTCLIEWRISNKPIKEMRLRQMPQFVWDNTYSVNNEKLDGHHKRLFELFNKLYEEYLHAENDICNSTIIDELVSYADYHFEAEEKYMADIGYKDIDNHIQMHRYFTQKAFEMRQVNSNNDCELTKELMDFLGNWLIQHVIEEDKRITIEQSHNK